MSKIISEFNAGKYKALTLDTLDMYSDYTYYVIDDKTYTAVPVYDLPNTIAIEAPAGVSFVGKMVEFK